MSLPFREEIIGSRRERRVKFPFLKFQFCDHLSYGVGSPPNQFRISGCSARKQEQRNISGRRLIFDGFRKSSIVTGGSENNSGSSSAATITCRTEGTRCRTARASET